VWEATASSNYKIAQLAVSNDPMRGRISVRPYWQTKRYESVTPHLWGGSEGLPPSEELYFQPLTCPVGPEATGQSPNQAGKGREKEFFCGGGGFPSAPPLPGATARGRKKRQAGASLMLLS